MKINPFHLIFILIPLFAAMFLFLFAWKKKHTLIFLAGLVIGLLFPTLFFVTFVPNGLSGMEKVGFLFGSIVIGFLFLNIFEYLTHHRFFAWSFPAISVLAGVTTAFLFTQYRLLDFILWIGLGVGIALLGSGIYWKLFGLVIPGSLVIGAVPGVYFAWAESGSKNALVQTSVMLVWFALGWGLVTIFARVRTLKFTWWPLIPGGIIGMVGWGLYIGGNPQSAVGFIGNTGSIGLLIFGIYILLMRRGIHH
jgi:hypothetical protein